MLKAAAVGLALATVYSDYPAFLRKGVGPNGERSAVEMYKDLGPIYELVVRCPSGTGIMSFSKTDRKYCSSKGRCGPEFASALADTCS